METCPSNGLQVILITYIKLFVDYLDAIEPLGDAERGRLFTALLEYARTGEAPQLSGNERFLFPMMRAQIDRDNLAAEGKSEARSAAGKKGAQAKASKAKQNKQMPDLLSKPSKDKDKDKDEDKKETPPPYGGGAKKNAANAVVAAVCADYLDRINATASQNCLEELAAYAETMGEAVCKRAFDIALDAKKATWPYIRAILRDKQAKGVKCLADWDAIERNRVTKSPGGRVPVTGFQVDANRIQKNNEWLDSFLAEQDELTQE